jgi:hypothetical protein
MLRLEAVLGIALVAVYLLDSAHLLSIGDALLLTRRGHLRQVTFGWAFELAGRRPYLPNPLTPFWPELRIQWTSALRGYVEPDAAASQMLAFITVIRPLSQLAALTGLFIVVVAPLALAAGSEAVFLAAAAIAFVLAAAACCLMIARRKAIGLERSQVISVSLVALLCLPCAANLARAVAKQRCWLLAASDIPALGFSATDAEHIKHGVTAFLHDVRRLFPEDTAQYGALTSQIELLERPRP